MRNGRNRDPSLLLSRAPLDRRQLPNVPRRNRRRSAEARGLLRDANQGFEGRAGWRASQDQDQQSDGQKGSRRSDGVPPDQSPARLSDLRSGRRVRPAGSGDVFRRRHEQVPRAQKSRRGSGSGSAGRNAHDSLHIVHALRAVHDRSRGRGRDGTDRSRRGRGNHELSQSNADVQFARQRCRSLPGRRFDLQALRVHRQAMGAEKDRNDRRDGCPRIEHQGRYERARGHAHPAEKP